MGLVNKDDGWRVPDALWERLQPLLPVPNDHHPLGCHRPRTDDRRCLDAILLVLRTGMQWNALKLTGPASSSTAHRRFQEWVEAGVFSEFWKQSLQAYDKLKGIDWQWQAMDGAMTKAPLGGEKNRPQSNGSRQGRHEAKHAGRWKRSAHRAGHRRSQPERLQAVP